MSIGEFFTRKVGPLPVWGWGAIAAGGTFVVLKSSGASGGAKKGKSGGKGAGSGNGNGGTDSSGSFTGTSNTTSTFSGDQTFGGGSLGFLGTPFGNWGNLFVHLHPHGGGGFRMGGRHYSNHAFRSHGFGRDGHRDRGGRTTDHRHGAFGGRPFRGGSSGGHPRGFGEGHYNPGRGLGSRIAGSFNPRNTGNRGTSWTSQGPQRNGETSHQAQVLRGR